MNITIKKLEERRANWSPPDFTKLAGALQKYAAAVGPANLGAVTHAGNVQWERELNDTRD